MLDPIVVSAGGVGLLAGILAYGWMLSRVAAERVNTLSLKLGDERREAAEWPLATSELESETADDWPSREASPVAEQTVAEQDARANTSAVTAELIDLEDEVTPEDIRSIVAQVTAELKPQFDNQVEAQGSFHDSLKETLAETLSETLRETLSAQTASLADSQYAIQETIQSALKSQSEAILESQKAIRESMTGQSQAFQQGQEAAQEIWREQTATILERQDAAQESLASQTAAVLEEQRAAQETLVDRMAAILDGQIAAQQALANQMAAILDSQIAVQEALQHQAATVTDSQVAIQQVLRDQTSVIADSQMAAQDALQTQTSAILERLEAIANTMAQISVSGVANGGLANGSGALVAMRGGQLVETVVMRRKYRFTDLNDELVSELGELPPGERLSLGSDPASDICIEHEAVAEHHADLYSDGSGKLRLRLTSATDGEGNAVTLRVNNLSLHATGDGHLLSDGDKLLLGRESANDPEWAPRKALLFSATEIAADKKHRTPRAASKPGRWTR